MAYNFPTGDFVTTTLNGAISAAANSATIGTGLDIPAANGILQIDYDSTEAVGADNGPETISYTSYTTATGALAGISRGIDDNTSGVAHADGASVQAAMSSQYLGSASIDTADIATDAVTDDKMDYPRFWSEIGRTTLGSAGDTITVSSLPTMKYLKILVKLIDKTDVITTQLTFNNDGGNNYANRRSDGGGADATATSAAFIAMRGGVAENLFTEVTVENTATKPKLASYVSVGEGADGAGNAPNRSIGTGKWHNVADQITRVDITNGGAGDYDTGSEVVVLGHN